MPDRLLLASAITQQNATIVRTRMMPRALTFLLLAVLTGCGYHQAGSAAHLPANVRTLSVPVFATKVQAYRTEMAFTQAVVREFNTRTKYRVSTSDTEEADATLHGTILSETIAPLTYDATTSQSSSYLVTVTAKAVLTGHDGRVLYENDAITFREQYQSTQDLSGFIQEGSPAITRMSRDFAQTLVSDILESF
jgi:outer membrane lipopolysaccharide assembly protein LptE/RlpB